MVWMVDAGLFDTASNWSEHHWHRLPTACSCHRMIPLYCSS